MSELAPLSTQPKYGRGYHHEASMAEYLKDPAPEPSLSTSTVCDLDKRTPLRAFTYHPRLGRRRSESTARGDLGTAVHSLVLGGTPIHYAPAGFDDWKKKAAQEFRDGIREMGAIALLDRQREAVERAAESARGALAAYGTGRTEVTMLWEQPCSDGSGAVWCRGRADWLDDAGAVDVDLKTVEDLDPDEWERRCVEPGGLDVQAALRSLGHEALTGKPREMLWLLQDIEAPYDCAFVGLAPSLAELARRKVDRAAIKWRACLTLNKWPGYGRTVRYAEARPWAERAFEERGLAPV
jgi:hypothetical protein